MNGGRTDFRALFLPISGRSGASSRYRVYGLLPYLEGSGIACRVIEPPQKKGRGLSRLVSGFVERRGIYAAASGSGVVFIQKRLFDPSVIKQIARSCPRIVFDFDDSIFTSPSGDWSGPTRARVHGRIKAVMGAADLVIAGNAYLKEAATGFGARKVAVLPTALDTRLYAMKAHKDGPVTLGWIGSAVNYRYLDMLADALRKLSGACPDIRLLVVSDSGFRMDGVNVENRRWSEETEVRDILDMDIGLMPLHDDEWTRGKCAFKAIQYMAAGIPAVASPVGANVEAVTDGVEGFLPGTDEQWVEKLRLLIVSSGMRGDMGRAGREKVQKYYDIEAVSARLAGLLEDLL